MNSIVAPLTILIVIAIMIIPANAAITLPSLGPTTPIYTEYTHYITNNSQKIAQFSLLNTAGSHSLIIPEGAHIFYDNNGAVAILSPNNTIVQHIIPQTNDGYSIPRVFEVPKGATVKPIKTNTENKLLVQYYDITLLEVDLGSTDPTDPGVTDNISQSWVDWVDLKPNSKTNYKSFTTEWTVPPNPTSTQDLNKAALFFFNGFNAKSKNPAPQPYIGGIVQPVLAWVVGPNLFAPIPTSPHPSTEVLAVGHYSTNPPLPPRWIVCSVYCYKFTDNNGKLDSVALHGQPFTTTPGHIIRGELELSPRNNGWDITTTDLTSGQSSFFNAPNSVHSSSEHTEPVIATEDYGIPLIKHDGGNKEYWPPINSMDFVFTSLTSTTNTEISSKMSASAHYNKKIFDASNAHYDRKGYKIFTNHWPTIVSFQFYNPS
jgi:hypothetical protein